MTIAEQRYTLVKTLPQDDANEILTFAQYTRSKRDPIVPELLGSVGMEPV
jgi:hypothetical protein